MMGLTPTQSPTKFTTLLMGLSLLGDDPEPNFEAGMSPIQSPKYACTVDGITPTRKQT